MYNSSPEIIRRTQGWLLCCCGMRTVCAVRLPFVHFLKHVGGSFRLHEILFRSILSGPRSNWRWLENGHVMHWHIIRACMASSWRIDLSTYVIALSLSICQPCAMIFLQVSNSGTLENLIELLCLRYGIVSTDGRTIDYTMSHRSLCSPPLFPLPQHGKNRSGTLGSYNLYLILVGQASCSTL